MKGILPVSDVVYIKDFEGKGSFYSYIDETLFPVEKYLNVRWDGFRENIGPKFDADKFILENIFMDYDHDNSNVIADGEKYYFYDLEHCGDWFWSENYYKVGEIRELIKKIKPEMVNYLKIQLTQLLNRLDGAEGLNFLKSIIESKEKDCPKLPFVIQEIPANNTEEKIEFFHSELVKRIKVVYKILWEEVNSGNPPPDSVMNQELLDSIVLERSKN